VGGEPRTVETTRDDDGTVIFDLPPEPAAQARVGITVEGATPVDLEPDGAVLEAGEVVLVFDDAVPSHLRFAGP
jgi:hypothetical protein